MAGIFISYRRSDIGSYAAGRLHDALARRFGRDHVFMDIDSLKGHAGLDFSQALDQAVTTCDAMVALIGPEWLTATDAAGKRRLDDPEDWVRQEIALALARPDIRVIPVLMGDVPMPKAEALPDDLKALARRQKHEISESRWDYDVAQLVDNVLAPLMDRDGSRLNRRTMAISLVAIVAGGAGVTLVAAVWPEETPDRQPATPPTTNSPPTPRATTTQNPVAGAATEDHVSSATTLHDSDTSQSPEPSQPTLLDVVDTGGLVAGGRAVVTSSGVPLLEQPSNMSNRVGDLYYGDVVVLVEGPIRSGGSTWWQIKVEVTGASGFFNEMFLAPL